MNEDKKLTTEQAERLLKAIFSAEDELTEGEPGMDIEEPNENWPETFVDKIGYAEHVAVAVLEDLSPAIRRLSRLHRLLIVGEKGGEQSLPDVITHNEARMALQYLLRVERDIKEIAQMVMEVHMATRPEGE